jgi:hypothetical protein
VDLITPKLPRWVTLPRALPIVRKKWETCCFLELLDELIGVLAERRKGNLKVKIENVRIGNVEGAVRTLVRHVGRSGVGCTEYRMVISQALSLRRASLWAVLAGIRGRGECKRWRGHRGDGVRARRKKPVPLRRSRRHRTIEGLL